MIVKVENVSKVYNKIPVIREMSIDIEKGERVVILGPSGCGKTTLLRLIAGFIHPDKGKIAIDGKAVSDNGKCIIEPEGRQVGMVFQDLALWPHMSSYKNIEFGLKAKRVSKAEIRERIDAILEKVQMVEFRNTYPGELSGGQQQRIALARALVTRPKILLMDEPLSSLDADLRHVLMKEILRLQEELAITMIYVTHDREEAFSLATRIVVMTEGKIQKIGTVSQIKEYLS
ncbi:MAG: ABC transporter ATP-binding protein [Candidatus Scalindua sp.]|jgi:ABC-type Fe3+/spermidine/putrescine transport system ATPase subunit|nr:ABC transporter ATP-binding protein [Candidatus Scalindua sp.]MBT6045690.1 ABC transporter ATP-binding protein [Candidatus Scalindua sp.]